MAAPRCARMVGAAMMCGARERAGRQRENREGFVVGDRRVCAMAGFRSGA